MRVRQRCMTMRVAVPQAGLAFPIVRMPVVFVVDMLMRVLKRLVRVFMDVPLGQMQPHPSGHQGTRQQQTRRDRLAKPSHRKRCAKEGLPNTRKAKIRNLGGMLTRLAG